MQESALSSRRNASPFHMAHRDIAPRDIPVNQQWRHPWRRITFGMETTTPQTDATAFLPDRVRRHTAEPALNTIDERTRASILEHGNTPWSISERLAKLEWEWDVERVLEANASVLSLSGSALGMLASRRWFLLPIVVFSFLIQHASSGWCPPLPVLRRFRVRTQSEIDRERYALKAIRGDFRKGTGERVDTETALRQVASQESGQPGSRGDADRVRRHTHPDLRRRLDREMAERVRHYAGKPREVISERIGELQREWSIERHMQAGVAAAGLASGALALGRTQTWGIVTMACAGILLLHAVEGARPALCAARNAGVRSRQEINREIYALKILRGDFDDVGKAWNLEDRISAALRAVRL